MVDSTVSTMTAASTLDGTELYYGVQGGADKKVTGAQIKTLVSASPTLVTPALGTPASGVMTNVTGLPLTTGVTGTLPVANGGTGITSLGTGVATALGTAVNGSGAISLTTSPTFVTPALGTPSSGTLTNCTGLPATTGVTGILPVANGGTGTASPGIVAGTNVTVTGTWPNQTVNSTASGGSFTGGAISSPIQVTGGTVTTNNPIEDNTQTWNAGAVAFTGYRMNITNTASASGSLLMDLQVGGASQFSVSKAGAIAATSITVGGSGTGFSAPIIFTSGYGFGLSSGNIGVQSSAACYWQFNNDASFGMANNSYTSDLKFIRVAPGIVKIANGSTGPGVVVTQSTTVASLPAAATAGAGARAFVTDATASTFASTVAGGGSTKVPVYSDGTNWLVG